MVHLDVFCHEDIVNRGTNLESPRTKVDYGDYSVFFPFGGSSWQSTWLSPTLKARLDKRAEASVTFGTPEIGTICKEDSWCKLCQKDDASPLRGHSS